MEQATYHLYVDWDNDGAFTSPGDDCSADFVRASISRGFSDPLARVVTTGRATIVLNNASRAYSPPLSANLVPRRPMLLQMKYGGVTAARFAGYVEAIRPNTGRWAGRRVTLECVDALMLLDLCDAQIPLLTDVHADDVIDADSLGICSEAGKDAVPE